MIAVYSIVRGKPELVRKSFKLLRTFAGCEYAHYVVHNGNDADLTEWLEKQRELGRIEWLLQAGVNYGQNIAANLALDELMRSCPDWVLRWDPDAIPRTRRFLRKMVRCATEIGEPCVLGPTVTMLKHPMPTLESVQVNDWDLDVVGMLGGICRLHPAHFFDGWRFNKFGALGFGEAAEVADRCTELRWGVVRMRDIEVEHAYGEDGQAERWPDQFGWEKEVSRYVSYGL